MRLGENGAGEKMRTQKKSYKMNYLFILVLVLCIVSLHLGERVKCEGNFRFWIWIRMISLDRKPGSATMRYICVMRTQWPLFIAKYAFTRPTKKNISSDSTQRERSAYILNEPTFNILYAQEVVTLLKKYLIYLHQKMRFTPFINYYDTLGWLLFVYRAK